MSDLALHFLAKMKIMVVKDIEREDVEFFCKVCSLLYKFFFFLFFSSRSHLKKKSRTQLLGEWYGIDWKFCCTVRHVSLLGNCGKGTSWFENIENVQMFPSAGLSLLFYQYLYKRGTFASDRLPQGAAMLVCFLPVKIRKMLAHDMFHTSASDSSLIHVTGTYCWST